MNSIIALIIGIALLLVLIMKTKIQAFPALIVTSIVMGLLSGLPAGDTMKAVSGGFGSTLGSIGIVIGFGCIMGKFLEKSGAAKKMALSILKLVGVKRADVVLGLSGLIVSIPVFCDSGFVILSELAREFSRLTKRSMVVLGGMLAMGLYITHYLVPPTPGPLAVAGLFKIDLGVMIFYGILLSIPLFIFSLLYFRYIEKKAPVVIPERSNADIDMPKEKREVLDRIMNKYNNNEALTGKDFEDMMQAEDLPGTFASFAPVIVPVLLILLNTFAKALNISGAAGSVISIIGDPITALFISVLLSIYVLCAKMSREDTIKLVEESLADAGLIILVTGAGGSLGNIIRVTNIGNVIAESIVKSSIPVILIPILLGALLKTIQGSGTVAMITGASILAPMLASLGLNPVIAAMALCTSAMIVSYPNDSYFWVVTRFSGLEVETSLKSWTLCTAVVPTLGCILLVIINLFI